MPPCIAAPVTNSALPKNLFTDTQPNNNLSPLSSSDLTGKPVEPLTAPILPPSNGTNGSVGKTESAVSDDTRQTSAPGAAVMTGALPLTGDSSTAAASLPNKPVQSTEKDGVEDITEAGAVPKPAASTQSDGVKETVTDSGPLASSAVAPTALNGADKKDAAGSTVLTSEDKPSTTASITAPAEKADVEMKDAPVPSTTQQPSTLASAPPAAGADISGLAGATVAPTPAPALATPATAATEPATGEKRKADADDVEEPAAKKPKGTFAKAVDKAKSAIQDVKEKAKPGRKPGSKAKKEAAPPPVGRTERKTRSQARAE